MKKQILIFSILIILSLTLVSAEKFGYNHLEELPTAKLNQQYTITQTCASCSYVNISVKNIDGFVLNNVEMSNNGSGVWIYDYTPTTIGRHDVIGKGDLGGTDTSFATYFEVTSTGKSFTDGQSLSSLGILFGSLVVSFLFLFIGFKISEEPKMVPIAFIFIVLSIILIIYSLFLGWTIGSDIIEHEAFSETSEVIFTAVLWLMVAVVLISFIFFIFSFIKEFGRQKKIGKFGEGFNPITDSYDY